MTLAVGLVVAILLGAAPERPARFDAVTAALYDRFDAAVGEPSALSVGREPLHAGDTVRRFYQERRYRPAWSDAAGSLHRVAELADAVGAAAVHGLEPTHYHLDLLRRLLTRAAGSDGRAGHDPDLLADLELAASDAFLVYGAHLAQGRVDPVALEPDWWAQPRQVDLVPVLADAVARDRIGEALQDLLPVSRDYRRLEEALARYRALAASGGFEALAPGPRLELGSSGERVRLLRRRLAATGDLEPGAVGLPEVFDLALDRATRAFQARHGLEVDGVVGPRTTAALDFSAADRVAQIALNLERWRWLPRDLGSLHVLVNVPAFELRLIEDDAVVMAMRAVVGKPYRRTPVFSATLTYVVVSPYWHVPPGIAARDILPAVRKDPSYLAQRGLRVFEGWGADQREIDPGGVDWRRVSAAALPYHFRQEPGDQNMLGRIKLMFPNRYNVYLHDSPQRELFLPARRDFSSGCIRIERPFDLAAYLLRDDPAWPREALIAAATIDAETLVPLRRGVPVHVLYWTAWAEDGTVHFREDLYGRDASLAAALATPPPSGRRAATGGAGQR